MAYGGLPFPHTGCLVPDVYIYYVPDMMSGYCFYLYPPPLDVSGHGLLFDNGLDNTEWASFISYLHTKLRIISREIQGFATGLLAGFVAVDEPLAPCMMVHCRVFGFQK